MLSTVKNKPGIRVTEKLIFLVGAALPELPPGEEIYDIKNPVEVPFPWLYALTVVLLTTLVGWAILKLYLRCIEIIEERKKILPPIDHLKEALKALDRLRISPIWENGSIKDICESVAGIFKVFLKNRFSLGLGAAATSDELLGDLRFEKIPENLVQTADRVMSVCDAVKFAKGDLGDMTPDSLVETVKNMLLSEEWQR